MGRSHPIQGPNQSSKLWVKIQSLAVTHMAAGLPDPTGYLYARKVSRLANIGTPHLLEDH